ncbi:MAG: LCP family protein [Anaerolineaceae bacterium]|nr:LCP family protein [Anaerolineaceae bacterium]
MTQPTQHNMAHTPRRSQKMDKTSRILLISFAVVGLLLAFFAGRFVYNTVKAWQVTSLPGAPVGNLEGQPITENLPDLNIKSEIGPEPKLWDGKSRVNILFLGLDATNQRELMEPGPRFSDTMILVTIDPLTQSLGALSIRRDLWVNIPGYDYHKINKAHFLGEAQHLPGGGAGLAVATVEQFLGVPIHFYAKVDFNTFVKVIDELQGVTIEVKEPILADWGANGNNFWLEPGEYTLPGTYALAYARYRGSDGGDIDRGDRQMQVLMAIRDRILDFKMLPDLIKRAPTLYNDISAGVQTNMTFDQAVQMLALVTKIPRENFRTFNITYDHAAPEMITTLDEGMQYILRPFPDRIRELRDQIFVSQGVAAAPVVMESSDPLQLALAENARITVLNGTNTGSLAENTGSFLTTQGLNVVEVGSSEPYAYTSLIIHNATPYTLAYLSSLMQVPSTRIFNQFNPDGATDITVYLGNDWASTNPMP